MTTEELEKIIEKMFNPDGSVNQEEYDNLIKALYQFDKFYTVVSPSQLKKSENGKMHSVPFASVALDRPVIYLFTEKHIAEFWCESYKASGFITQNNEKLISVIYKKDGYSNLFPRCRALGIGSMLVNEGARYVCVSINKFIADNKIDEHITMGLSEIQVIDLLQNNRPSINCELPVLEVIEKDAE